jgi:DNA-binding PadR family transcriptional regulator
MEDKLLKDLFLGFIKVHILHHAAVEKIFGQEFNQELKKHGYHVSYGTLYPIFHKLEAEGFLKSETKNINGKVRRYYAITKSGEKILKKAKKQAKELVEELDED